MNRQSTTKKVMIVPEKLMDKYADSFENYLNDLGKKKPAPGGGSAISLLFCLGTALIEKAVNYSVFTQKELKAHLTALKNSRRKVSAYIDLDGQIFNQVLKEKGKAKEKLLAKSEAIICDISQKCVNEFLLAKRIESAIKKSIISDFWIGCELLRIVLKGCVINLEANSTIFGKKNKKINEFKRILEEWQ